MAEIGRQGSGIDTLIDQLEPGPVPQQMRMHVNHAETGRGAAQRLEEAVGRERRPALAHKHMTRPGRLIASQLAQCPNFDTAQRLHTVITAFAADYLQAAGFEVDLIPTQSHKFTDAQPMPVSQEDHGGISMPVTTASAGGVT